MQRGGDSFSDASSSHGNIIHTNSNEGSLGDTVNLEETVKKKNAKILSLERLKSRHTEELSNLRSELGKSQIKHNEEIYWMRLECDSLRRDKENLEERLTDLTNDIQDLKDQDSFDIDNEFNDADNNANNPAYVKHLQQQLTKAMTTIGILDNQMTMIKKSCDDVVKSLKEEIGDVMEDKCRVEMELMNQLAVLDNEKCNIELELEEQIKVKEDTISELNEENTKLLEQVQEQKNNNKNNDNNNLTSSSSQRSENDQNEKINSENIRKIESLEKQMNELRISRNNMEDRFKEEINDLHIDKQDIEEDLQRQVDDLHIAKEKLEHELDRIKHESNEGMSSLEDVNMDLTKEIERIKIEREQLEEQLVHARAESNDAMSSLEEANLDLAKEIERLKSDYNDIIIKQKEQGDAAANNAVKIKLIDTLSKDRKDVLSTLERVAMMWEKADESIQNLDAVIDILRPQNDDDIDNVHDDRERILSTLETASLVHGQVKVALLLVELKLRNQLNQLKNDSESTEEAAKAASSVAARNALNDEVIDKIKEVQEEAVVALEQVEYSLSEQIKQVLQENESSSKKKEHEQQQLLEQTKQQLEEQQQISQESTNRLKNMLLQAKDEIQNLQQHNTNLNNEIQKLEHDIEEQKKQKEADDADAERYVLPSSSGANIGVSRSVMERLQEEILQVVKRVKEKNDTIASLKAIIEEHKVRESEMKKQMKRLYKRYSVS